MMVFYLHSRFAQLYFQFFFSLVFTLQYAPLESIGQKVFDVNILILNPLSLHTTVWKPKY